MNQVVPLQSIPNQAFTVSLTVDSAPLVLLLSLNYDSIKGYWDMVVSNQAGTVLIDSVPLTTGEYPAANLLGQYQYMELGSAYLLNTGGAASDYPTANNLEAFSLVWGDTVQ
jgi:hypothetical protein